MGSEDEVGLDRIESDCSGSGGRIGAGARSSCAIILCAPAFKTTIQKSIWQRFEVPKMAPRVPFTVSLGVLGATLG